MYAADREEDCSKGNEGYAASRSIALVKQSDHVDEDTRHSVKCSHVCKYCKREFSSGRALGGHMRAHGSLSLEAEAEAAADWHTNHHHQVAGGIHEILEQLSSSGGDGDSRSALRDYFLDADNNLHVVSDSTQALSCTRIKLDFRPGKPYKEFGDDLDAARGRRKDNDDDYQGEKEYDEDASFKASTTSTTYSNVLEDGDGDGDNAHETELDNAKFKARGPFYVLRRNRKPSKRLVDRENYAMESMQAFLSASPLKKATASSSSLNNKSHACSECGKEFFSWKALFGHMRCHPEREWRGIQRPISQDSEKQLAADTFLPVASSACKLKKTSSSPQKDSKSDSAFKPVKQTISDDSDAESIEAAYMNGGGKDHSLQSWTTGKRSKRSRQIVRSLQAVTDNILPEVGSFHASSEIKEDADMANCLVMLACASRNQKEHSRSNNFMTRTMSISSNDLDRRSDERDITYKKRSMDIDVRPYHWPHRKDPSKIIVKDVYADDGSLCEGMNEEDRRGEETTTKTRRTDLAGKSKYECSTCKRLFKSHQALGGHRASHKKVKGCFARTHAHPSDDGDIPDSPEEDVTDLDLPRYWHEPELLRASGRKYHHEHQIYGDGEDEKETTSYRSKTHARMKRHECSICHRVFSSGQALGGHKRCHWGGDGSETSAVPASASKQPATAVQLDLNLPAPEEYEEFYMDCKLSPTAAHANILTTKSISDENIMPQKSPGEFISSVNDSQQKPTDHTRHSRERQFLHSPGLKPAASQAGTRAVQNHDAAEEYSELQITNAERNTMNSNRYMQCNICDQIFNSVEALGSHQNTHASVMSTLAGLTPISA